MNDLLEQAYFLVERELSHSEDSEDSEILQAAQAVAWAPIVRTCVTATMRAILTTGDPSALGHDPLLAARLGLSLTDTRLAIEATIRVLNYSELFKDGRDVYLRGQVLRVTQTPQGLTIGRVA